MAIEDAVIMGNGQIKVIVKDVVPDTPAVNVPIIDIESVMSVAG